MRSAQYLQLSHNNPLVEPLIATSIRKGPLQFVRAVACLGLDPVHGADYLHISYLPYQDDPENPFDPPWLDVRVLDDKAVADFIALQASEGVDRAKARYCASLGAHSHPGLKGPRYTQTMLLLNPPRRRPGKDEAPWVKSQRPWTVCLGFRNSHSRRGCEPSS